MLSKLLNRSDEPTADWSNSMGYEVVQVIKKTNFRHVLRVKKNGSQYLLKTFFNLDEPSLRSETFAYKSILPKLNGSFRRLVAPKVVETKQFGEPGQVDFGEAVVMEWICGRDFNDRWSEADEVTAGGRAIPVNRVDMVLDLIEDLQSIDAEEFLSTGLRKIDGHDALRITREVHLHNLTEDDLLTESEKQQICELISGLTTDERNQISNEDFQFRNFIELDAERTALIDWDGTRVSSFELEHCIANQWVLMWNNEAWRSNFLARARDRFNLNLDRFRAVAVHRALAQGLFVWKSNKDLRRTMLDCAKDLLRDEYIDDVWCKNC